MVFESLRRAWNEIKECFFVCNPTGFRFLAVITLIVEFFLSLSVVNVVKYTEIDWSTYMQQVECVTEKGIYNYSLIGGDTGPCVYPAGHLFIFQILHYFTNRGRNILVAQYIFMAFYLVNLALVFRILYKTHRIPPFVLLLCSITGYRIHSIFMLRLFNDPIAMLFFYIAFNFFIDYRWLAGCIFYSLAVSIKMNVLLFAPAMFFMLLLNNGFLLTFGYILVCGFIQLQLAVSFLWTDWKSYLIRSFDLSRVFMFKWTVNWRFLPESIFLDKRFHVALLIGHLTILALFAYHMWFRNTGGLRWRTLRCPILTSTGAAEMFFAFSTSNLIGIAFSRSLHYQFFSWYYHQLPFLLFFNWNQDIKPNTIPWLSILWKCVVLLLIELCWNVYPSTWWSSALLHVLHAVILVYVVKTRGILPEERKRYWNDKMDEKDQAAWKQILDKKVDAKPEKSLPKLTPKDQIKARKMFVKPTGLRVANVEYDSDCFEEEIEKRKCRVLKEQKKKFEEKTKSQEPTYDRQLRESIAENVDFIKNSENKVFAEHERPVYTIKRKGLFW